MTNPSNASSLAKASGQANMSSNGSRTSISSQQVRKRDKIFNLLRPAKPGKTTKMAGNTGPSRARSDIFMKNMKTPVASVNLPKTSMRIDSTPQLALCSSLLLKSQGCQEQAKDQAKGASLDVHANRTHLEWVKTIENDIVEQDHIRWLGTRMVEEFSKDAVKDSPTITEVVLLGPVLNREHYRKLLNCLISEFKKAEILDVHLLQGLVQLVQCASDEYLVADDLVKTMSILRSQLQNTHQQSTEHSYQLTLAVSRLLDVMAEHKVQDVKRVKEHEPLSEILSVLKSSSDPFLMYQASYAFQALQYVSDDETALQATLRHSAGVVESVVKISGVLKMDLGSVLEGLKGFQEALSSTYDTAKSGYEGFLSLMESGRGVFDSLKEGLSTGQKRLWYPALRAADGFVRQGQLADLNQLIVEAPCRRDPLFQWGICQLLGELAVDEAWEVGTRQQAMDLFVDLYSNDAEWAQDESVNDWMLAIIEQLRSTSDPVIKDHAKNLLSGMKTNVCSATSHSYPLKSRLSMPVSSPLLTRVQEIPYVEYDLHQLKKRRLESGQQSVYIPPLAKPQQQAPDSDVFPLMENVTEFLTSKRQVMLILGDSGAGKSTFNRHLECTLWREYKSGGRIPLFINMPALSKPESELIAEQLRMLKFSEAQIREIELHRQLIVICDGYDESQLTTNIHTTNQFNQPGQWNVKLLVSCRSQYLGHDYRDLFVPQGIDHYSAPALHLFQEAVITPFTRSQIEEYVEQYVPLEQLLWVTEDYMEKLTTIPNLMDLVTNPFLLTLALGALPSVVQDRKDLTTVRITRVALYDSFVEHWIGANKRRLQRQKLEQSCRAVLAELTEDDFERNGVEYQKQLAATIFQEQDGKPVVDYIHKRDKMSWKARFFGPDPEPTLLRGCSLLNRVGNQYRFVHRSILEYFYSRYVHEPSKKYDEFSPTTNLDVAALTQPIADHTLSQRSLVSEPSIIHFLCERVQEDVVYKEHLLAIIEKSKTDPDASQAASNAITILVRAEVLFNGADLQNIRIPAADLSGGQFDSVQLQGADLSNTNLRNIWLRQANLSEAKLVGVQFGEWPFLEEECDVESCAYSPDGETFAVGLRNNTISLYKTATWAKSNTLRDQTIERGVTVVITNDRYSNPVHSRDTQTREPGDLLVSFTRSITSLVFSPSGQQIASGCNDNTAMLWDAQTGAPGAILRGHSRIVTSVVFSPSGKQIASGSDDRTVRLWDAQTGAPGYILRGHIDFITSVVFSPSGEQIASGSDDETVRLWDAQTGAPGAILRGHTEGVTSVAFSPSGQKIASGSEDSTVRLWDAQAGVLSAILSGHTLSVISIAFSRSGQQVVSGSEDNTVRFWDAQTGASGATLTGHKDAVKSVVFSPSGQQFATGSSDMTVRLWDTQTGAPDAILSGHTNGFTRVVFSPSGQQIALSYGDGYVRLCNAQTGVPDAFLSGHTKGVTSVVFSPSGQQIALVCEDDTVRLLDAQTGATGGMISDNVSYVSSVVISPRGQLIASKGDDGASLWDVQAVFGVQTGLVISVVFSPSGQQIALVCKNNTVQIWDAQTGAIGVVFRIHFCIVRSVVFSPSGQRIASMGWGDTVSLWDAQTGASGPILRGHTHWVQSVVFSPSGQQVATGSMDSTVRIWDAQTGEPGAVLRGHTDQVTSVVFSPSGQQIASGSHDNSVRLWDPQTGAPGVILSDHTGHVNVVVFSPSGRQIASGSNDETMRLWDVDSGQCLTVVRGFYGAVTTIAWSAYGNGSYLATRCDDGSVRLWQVIGDDHFVQLCWSSRHDRLVVFDTNFCNAQGLSEMNTKLLKQRGAVVNPTSSKEP